MGLHLSSSDDIYSIHHTLFENIIYSCIIETDTQDAPANKKKCVENF